MEKQELVQISAKVEEAFYEVSAKGNHNDWFPCGRAYVKVRGTTSFVKAMKSTQSSNSVTGMHWVA